MVVAAALLPTATAHADATWTVSPGGSITANSSGPIWLSNDTKGREVDCDALTGSGTARSGSGQSGDKIAAFTGFTLTNCVAYNNTPYDITLSASPTTPAFWNAITYDGSDLTTLTLTNITGHLQAGDGCTADFVGRGGGAATMRGQFSNSSGAFTFGPSGSGDLTAANVGPNCPSNLLSNGDALSLNGTFVIAPASKITSP